MIITNEEKLMYDVMKSIYDSGIPVSFKGSMVLKACLIEAGYTENTRHTVDIDGNRYSNVPPMAEQMVSSLQKAIDAAGIPLKVSIYRMYGEGRSAGFELADPDTEEILFTMDIDVNRPLVESRVYEIEGITFRGFSLTQMIADKVAAISTDKVFRRIKDVVDLYYISHVVDFNGEEVRCKIHESGRTIEDFSGFTQKPEQLAHAYGKFRFSPDVEKPSFEELYQTVKTYISEVLPER